MPVVSGSTGWIDKYDATATLFKEKGGAFFYSSNDGQDSLRVSLPDEVHGLNALPLQFHFRSGKEMQWKMIFNENRS